MNEGEVARDSSDNVDDQGGYGAPNDDRVHPRIGPILQLGIDDRHVKLIHIGEDDEGDSAEDSEGRKLEVLSSLEVLKRLRDEVSVAPKDQSYSDAKVNRADNSKKR